MKHISRTGVAVILSAFLIGTLLVLGLPKIHLTHHHKLPSFSGSEELIQCSGILKKRCHVRLTTTIGNPERYRAVFEKLDGLRSKDEVIWHLVGNGGQIRTMIQIINVMKSNPARDITIVEGDVYSAHAMIAMSGDEIIIRENTMFLFHHSSAYSETDSICSRYKDQKDRGVSMVKKCKEFIAQHLAKMDTLLIHTLHGKLTRDELIGVLTGEDVIIQGYIMKKRLEEGVE